MQAYQISEWIKGLLAVPFVLHSQPTGVFEPRSGSVAQMAEEAHRRYAEIMKDVEDMIDDHSKCNASSSECSSHFVHTVFPLLTAA